MIINPRREAINECNSCDHNGMAEILPATGELHATLVRCPHDAHDLVEVKHRVAHERATARRPHLRPELEES